ncbi:MAG TPA: sigma-70 family RNA polymerase sigma factor [Planctomycetota bacterium]|nr:sigma-70 family RNA polymerase sigma factor [Planctomycetota bacterium]
MAGLGLLQTTGFADDPRQGNLRAFTQFVREHENGLYTYVLRLVGSREEAEDITQDALLEAYKTWNQVDPETPGGHVKWCYRIARNRAFDAQRKKKPRAIDDEELDRAADARSLRPEDVYEHRVQSNSMRDSIQSLEEKYRDVLVLRYQEELSYEQIAEILEVPVSTVETRIHRAKKMLREKLK